MNSDQIIKFLRDPAWDSPFFKKLAHNDTGAAIGHQGGAAIPKELRMYFPSLDEAATTLEAPTVERFIQAEMFVPGVLIGCNQIRYQLQTWGNTRSPESRLTGNLGPLRNLAVEDDLLILQRQRDRLDSYRLLLVRQTDAAYGTIDLIVGARRRGSLFVESPPVSDRELNVARATMLAEVEAPFVAIRHVIPRMTSTRAVIARDTAFRATLLNIYSRRCAVSGIALLDGTLCEVEAAHVIPLDHGGADEPRNGISLTGTLHWAFDHGLFGISDNRQVVVPERVMAIPENEWLMQFNGRAIGEATDLQLRTVCDAFEWHRQNIMH